MSQEDEDATILEDEHGEFTAREPSPRIDYIEDFYREKLEAREIDLDTVAQNVRRIGSLTRDEREHIIDHLHSEFGGE